MIVDEKVGRMKALIAKIRTAESSGRPSPAAGKASEELGYE